MFPCVTPDLSFQAERLNTNGQSDLNVSTSAVAKYLAKQKQLKQRQLGNDVFIMFI